MSIPTTSYAQWTLLNSGSTENLNSIAYFKPYEYIIYVVGNNGTILKSIDYGDSWLPQNSGTTKDLYSIHIINGKFGFISGSDGITLWTLDGGATWLEDTILV
ncbi:MAG: hypothetical protein IH946_05880, partial [Bacteroidetes bacterium]|nr:hypothetical protein [Bacteroidota bacterium]